MPSKNSYLLSFSKLDFTEIFLQSLKHAKNKYSNYKIFGIYKKIAQNISLYLTMNLCLKLAFEFFSSCFLIYSFTKHIFFITSYK